ncbi:hypothetical protein FRACYDRAFT_252198 [Fragilariopsis cylindrus CCMP1102]|uniref:USP8 dimerisation domain-containing protein n=1 Tax=Fragilariopsis cylindrus CCMP1102 TaxID=635003 RepID=A0A1E7ENC9_9STRA|nr:hypothetical protein FRACYDRAFT_252198 [Fragilariopsis cylindrus CCMP1102]|eukprot:OEU07073.1 hypothetical protein FRACYDRAFT_252198 [Fragilariopsis cylindrus CCMP1102]
MRNSYSSSNSARSRGGIFTSVSSSFATSTSTAPSSLNSSVSFSRRRALKDADSANQVRVVDSYPLSKYMTVAQRLFGYFEQAYESLHLDEAYVYGMRFAQLALTNLPKHREWMAGGVVEEDLKSQIAKVLSRLEIIKWRMDKEESMKLRTKILAQAEEEVRLQNQFSREQEQRINVMSADEDVNKHDSTEKVDKSAGKKAKGRLRKFLRMPKRAGSVAAKSNNDIENSSLSSLSSGGSQSRAQYEQQQVKSNINRNAFVRATSPVLVESNPTRYTIEQYPIVNEVTLKLQSSQTPSLLNLQSDYHHTTYNTTYGDTSIQQKSQIYRKEKEGVIEERELFNSSSRVVESVQVPLPLSSSQQSPDTTTAIAFRCPTADISDEGIDMTSSSVDATQTSSDEGNGEGVKEVLSSSSSKIVKTKDRVLAGITHQLLSIHREKDLNLYELVLEEMRDKISCIYVGHHDIFESSYRNDDEDRTTEKDRNVHSLPSAATEDTEEKSVENENTEVYPWTDKDPVSAPSKSPKNKDIFNSFDAFDDFLSTAFDDQIDDDVGDDDEESYMEFTVIEEEYTLTEEIDEIKEDLEEDEEESYTEYTVVEEGVKSSDFEKIERAKVLDDLTGSPRCVTSEKLELQNDKSSGNKFPTMSVDVSPSIIDDDNMTYITMDPWLEELDGNSSNHRYQTE